MLKIWGRVNSINVQKVMWAVGELKLPHERTDAGMAFGVVNTPEYRKMNPNGRVPTIDYDGFVLWESNVIVRYLYAKHGPARTLEQGYGEEKWMDWTTSTVGAPLTTVFWQLVRTPADKRDMPAVEAAIKQAIDIFRIADDTLASRAYMGGAEFSIGDIPFGCFVNRWMQLPIQRPDHPNLARYYERLKSRPAFRQHVAAIPLT
ncbi:MAG TPA: glutathione S-transferase [Burkholderiales bacterium]|nr:glutathione S-transferase [Burkholderiales bacterium]